MSHVAATCCSKGKLAQSSAAGVSSAYSSWAKSALSCRNCKSPMAIPHTAGLYKYIRENQKSEGTSRELFIFPQWHFSLCPDESPMFHAESPALALRLNMNFSFNHSKSFVSQHCFSTWGCSGNGTRMVIWEWSCPMSCHCWVRHKHEAKDCKSNQFCRDHSSSAVPLGPSCMGAQVLAHCAAYKSCFLSLL